MIKASLLFAVSCSVFSMAAFATEKTSPEDRKLITSAMSAAPRSISGKATIVAMEADGSMRTLQKGSNGWTCMPDAPSTPGDDPMCLDANAWEWAGAWMTHKPPPDKVGFIYMLKGGSDASNTDPYATEPADGQWVTTGPHVMVVGPAVKDLPGYVKGEHPDTKLPYVMWAGTPYEHLMVPVK